MEGRIWLTQKFWRGVPYARLLAGRGKREGRGEERKGRRGTESRKRGRKESWNRAADGLRPALLSPVLLCLLSSGNLVILDRTGLPDR